MGFLEDAKQKLDELTGEAQRRRDREAAQKAEVERQAELQRRDKEMEQAKENKREKAKQKALDEAERKKERGSPADRLAAQVVPGNEDRLREARERKPEPEKAPTPPAQEAERMKYIPAGLQRGPSPGGGNYVNPLAARPVQQQGLPEVLQQDLKQARAVNAEQVASPKREPTMIEKMQERQKNQRQEQAQKQIQQQTVRLDRDLDR